MSQYLDAPKKNPNSRGRPFGSKSSKKPSEKSESQKELILKTSTKQTKSKSPSKSSKRDRPRRIELTFADLDEKNAFDQKIRSKGIPYEAIPLEFLTFLYKFKNKVEKTTLDNWIKESNAKISEIEDADVKKAIQQSKSQLVHNNKVYGSFGLLLKGIKEEEKLEELKNNQENAENAAGNLGLNPNDEGSHKKRAQYAVLDKKKRSKSALNPKDDEENKNESQ